MNRRSFFKAIGAALAGLVALPLLDKLKVPEQVYKVEEEKPTTYYIPCLGPTSLQALPLDGDITPQMLDYSVITCNNENELLDFLYKNKLESMIDFL